MPSIGSKTCRNRGWVLAGAVVYLLIPAESAAQFNRFESSLPPIGEDYAVELMVNRWFPSSDVGLVNGGLGVLGEPVDLARTFGLQDAGAWFSDFRFEVRPASRHKIKLHYTPLRYRGNVAPVQTFTADGQLFPAGDLRPSQLDWRMVRLGYEFDFIRRSRGFVGFMIDARFIDGDLDFAEPRGPTLAQFDGPFGTLGLIGRGHLSPRVSVTGEVNLTPFSREVLEAIDDEYDAAYVDLDVYVTFNFARWFALQAGYRVIDIQYRFRTAQGDLEIDGGYAGVTLRY